MKIVSEFNASVGACQDGYDGVLVELMDPATGRRRLGARGTPNVAVDYIARLSARVQRYLGHKRSLSQLLMVQATFATLMDGFAATLDDAVLDVVLNDTSEVLGVEANW